MINWELLNLSKFKKWDKVELKKIWYPKNSGQLISLAKGERGVIREIVADLFRIKWQIVDNTINISGDERVILKKIEQNTWTSIGSKISLNEDIRSNSIISKGSTGIVVDIVNEDYTMIEWDHLDGPAISIHESEYHKLTIIE